MNREAERKRLVELIDNFCKEELGANLNKDILEKVADNILDDGWMRPPVKVGQTVYVIYDKKVYEAVAEQVSTICHISGKKLTRIKAEFDVEDWFYKDGRKTKYGIFVFYPDEVFTSREQAQKALEGKEDEGK